MSSSPHTASALAELQDVTLEHAIRAADDARKRQRDLFHSIYGAFAKCDQCGKYGSLFRVFAPCATAPFDYYAIPRISMHVCTGSFRPAGYAPPPQSLR